MRHLEWCINQTSNKLPLSTHTRIPCALQYIRRKLHVNRGFVPAPTILIQATKQAAAPPELNKSNTACEYRTFESKRDYESGQVEAGAARSLISSHTQNIKPSQGRRNFVE